MAGDLSSVCEQRTGELAHLRGEMEHQERQRRELKRQLEHQTRELEDRTRELEHLRKELEHLRRGQTVKQTQVKGIVYLHVALIGGGGGGGGGIQYSKFQLHSGKFMVCFCRMYTKPIRGKA